MKNYKYIIGLLSFILFFTSCQDDTAEVGDLIAPSNVVVTTEIVGADVNNPNGDGSGTVKLKVSADNALSYHFVYNGEATLAPKGEMIYDFAITGLNTYTVTVIAYGTGGNSSSKTIQLKVLALYEPPADLLQMLVGTTSKTWRIKAEGAHFGLGPVGGEIFAEWFSAGANTKEGVGMYDDRYIFNADGTFTHETNGTVFGRENLINEIGGPGDGTADGADILNYTYADYTENWTLSAPGGKETISLSGLGFMGYYTGGNHKYEIFERSASEMVLRTTDGNGEFDWWFVLTSDDGSTPTFVSEFNNLVWSDEFDTDGAPDATKWTYDLGSGSNGWGNNEAQTYTDNAENVIVEDGALKIMAKADGNGGYTSSRIKTENLYEFTYGRVEVRAKLPATQGTWPAIWMLGANFDTVGWPVSGEIDIMEQTGQDKSKVSGTVHHPGVSPGAGNTKDTSIANASTEFHNYTVEWTSEAIKFVLDDTVFHEVANTEDLPFNADFFLILNIAMGGTLGGDIDAAFTEDTMEIEYVRVYQ